MSPRNRLRMGRRPDRLLAATLVAAVGAALAAPLVSGDDPPTPAETIAYKRALLAKLHAQKAAAYHLESVERMIASPTLMLPPPGTQLDASPGVDVGKRAAAINRRATRRAYDGALPLMPHSRNFAAEKTCLDCHLQGMRLGTRYASPISHEILVNCTQCHIESRNLDLDDFTRPVPNDFRGAIAPIGGARAWTGAPPALPHPLAMRSNCLSCHGPGADEGLRTSHPARLNCVQCHIPAAGLDQGSPFFSGRDDLAVPEGPRPSGR